MDNIEQLLKSFYEGGLGQADIERLFAAFLTSDEVRNSHPEDAALILPLALARKDRREHAQGFGRGRRRAWRAVATLLIGLSVAGTAAAYAMSRQTRVYATNADCDITCAEQWLGAALETSL